MATIIATVWTSVRSSGKPMSTMRSGRQACLIKIEERGSGDNAVYRAIGLLQLSGLRRRNGAGTADKPRMIPRTLTMPSWLPEDEVGEDRGLRVSREFPPDV